ncbi:PilZ domain-containing protein [Xanthomonas maliensis]|uniref:PilZ domain-containing protein n=1 Tax=Xanthomonas maliensis TaxID=1321368 RepID=UPI0003A6F476|nr:PilZ domain-containing protein [Xanthomonas maliensis]KAB7771870.1 PilZ domain-containing protein [Xanthomonas maliensis]
MDAPGALAAAAEAALFGETLSCELQLPADFTPDVAAGAPQAAETLLRSLGQIEDLRSDESGEDRGDLPLLVQRMDAKLDLMLALIGRLVRQAGGGPAIGPVRWSVRGIRLRCDASPPAVGSAGSIRLQASDWLPEYVQFPADVLATASEGQTHWLWLRFAPLGPGLQDALERHLFRLHRRQVAEARRQR